MHSNLTRILRARQFVSKENVELQAALYIVKDVAVASSESAWTPRRELKHWAFRKLRAWRRELSLLVHAIAAARWGDDERCNLALDAILLHEETANRQ
jgi:hypothetical protein